MNKELFVSSTPHETKVGLVEDDQLAEIYLERENEYTLAGSIYKGRVTRVLPGMQSAFVDVGLERDAFLYVSDFLDLEDQDEDLTDAVPAGRPVQDLRSVAPAEANRGTVEPVDAEASEGVKQEFGGESPRPEGNQREAGSRSAEHSAAGNDQNQDRGRWRGRRRRGGRREERERGFERHSRPGNENASGAAQPDRTPRHSSASEYTPILLPGESISKYQRMAQPATAERISSEEPASSSAEADIPLTSSFPEDEPLFAAEAETAERVGESQEEDREASGEFQQSASTSVDWSHDFRHAGEADRAFAIEERSETRSEAPSQDLPISVQSDFTPEAAGARNDETPLFAAPGTIEEETIDDEEADSLHYEASSEDGDDEFEEETRAVGMDSSTPEPLLSDVRETVSEIHFSSLAESGQLPTTEESAGEGEDSEELDLEEAQAEAEALLDAEARANGTVDARAEVRAPAATAGYTQRAQRPAFDRRSPRGRRGGRRFRRRESQPVPQISDLLKEGQEILVQIAKEPIGKKGARITSHIALPGRFLVYMPTVNHTGVSRKIGSEEERQRLKRIVLSERDNGHGGFIVRTAAQNASEEELRADIRFLKGLWNDIKTRSEGSKPPALIYHDLNVVERVLRDQVTSEFSVIWVDTEPEYERILRFFNRFQPGMVKRVKLYTKETPLFEQFGLVEEMNKALKSKVWLKSGGYIVINQTEALVAIDINTGKYVGKTARLEDTIVKTNVDAIKEIVRQIRLRDLGGIIIIDFIDMDERRNRQRVMQALEEELRHDRAPSKVLQFNDFGLVAITRKRVKQSLERTIGTPCPYCQATGYVKSVSTICNEIYVEMRKICKHLEHEDVMLRAHPDVAKELKSNNARLLNEMEEMTKRTIIVKSDPTLHQEQFDIN
ncbi:MAG TPA: Rne/Rng family ribonuclease [Candidatus Sulfotelmatobacter sp.]|nr:Rne/Rng family ribonuclease [Candidatus Sulfotelmatobacter sp.]